MQKLKNWIFNYQFILLIFALLAIAVSLQRYLPAHTFLGRFSYYNNFILFKSSLHHLIEAKDMYIAYENEGAWDLYKYSPTFAVLMFPYAFIPDLPGLILWNLTNVLLVYLAIKKLPYMNDRNKKIMLWFVLPELILCAQSVQSNAIIAALFVLTYTAFENKNVIAAAIFIGLATCIKPYAIIIAFIFLFYPYKFRFVIASLFTALALIALPLVLTSYSNLHQQYLSWFSMMSNDYSNSTGLSVMALVNDISRTPIDKNIVILIGTILTFSTAIFYKKYEDSNFRVLFVSLLMIWVVIFNHKSESPTFIIPVIGVALWFFSRKVTTLNFILLMLVLVFCQLSSSDIFPAFIRHEIFNKIHIKVIPCFLVWIVVLVKMWEEAISGRGGRVKLEA